MNRQYKGYALCYLVECLKELVPYNKCLEVITAHIEHISDDGEVINIGDIYYKLWVNHRESDVIKYTNKSIIPLLNDQLFNKLEQFKQAKEAVDSFDQSVIDLLKQS